MRRELDRGASLVTLAPVWADLTRGYAARRHEAAIRELLPPGDWLRFREDAERGTLACLLFAAELAGHDTGAAIRHAVGRKDFTGARSIAAVLHGPSADVRTPSQPPPGTPRPQPSTTRRTVLAVALARPLWTRSPELNQAGLDRPVVNRCLSEVPTTAAPQIDPNGWDRGLTGGEAGQRTDAISKRPSELRPRCGQRNAACAALRPRAAEPGRPPTVSFWPGGPPTGGRGHRHTWRENPGGALPRTPAEWRRLSQLRQTRLLLEPGGHEAPAAGPRAPACCNGPGRAQAGARQIAEARGWHEATEVRQRQALAADTRTRRRHPGIDLPPLRGTARCARRAAPGRDAGPFNSRRDQARLTSRQRQVQPGTRAHHRGARRLARRNVGRKMTTGAHAEARPREVRTRRTAAPQEQLGGRRAARQARPDLEPEAV